MSGVYMRNRNLSSFEYFNTAVAIRNDVTRLVTSRDVPKSYRFIFAVPMAETARNVDERKRYMTLALADLNQLYQDMQSLLTMGLPIKAARLEGILDRIDSDIKLIKGARAGVKLIGKG